MTGNNNNNVVGEVLSVKVSCGDEIRRASLSQGEGHATLLELVSKLFNLNLADVVLKYQDDEGDKVTITSDAELKEAVRISKTMRLFVESKTSSQVAEDANTNLHSSNNASAAPAPHELCANREARKEERRAAMLAWKARKQEMKEAIRAAKESAETEEDKEAINQKKEAWKEEKRAAIQSWKAQKREAKENVTPSGSADPTVPSPARTREPCAHPARTRESCANREEKRAAMQAWKARKQEMKEAIRAAKENAETEEDKEAIKQKKEAWKAEKRAAIQAWKAQKREAKGDTKPEETPSGNVNPTVPSPARTREPCANGEERRAAMQAWKARKQEVKEAIRAAKENAETEEDKEAVKQKKQAWKEQKHAVVQAWKAQKREAKENVATPSGSADPTVPSHPARTREPCAHPARTLEPCANREEKRAAMLAWKARKQEMKEVIRVAKESAETEEDKEAIKQKKQAWKEEKRAAIQAWKVQKREAKGNAKTEETPSGGADPNAPSSALARTREPCAHPARTREPRANGEERRAAVQAWKARKQEAKEAVRAMKANAVTKEDREAIKQYKQNTKAEMKDFKKKGREQEDERKLRARRIEDVTIPDGSELSADVPVTKTWKLKNAGTMAWPAESQLTFLSRRSDDLNGPERTALPRPVEPGQEVEVSVQFITPSHPGSYKGFYRMVTPDGEKFGQRMHVAFVIPSVAVATQTIQ